MTALIYIIMASFLYVNGSHWFELMQNDKLPQKVISEVWSYGILTEKYKVWERQGVHNTIYDSFSFLILLTSLPNVHYVPPNSIQNCLQLLGCIRPSFAASTALQYILYHSWTQWNRHIPVSQTVPSSCKQLTWLSFMLPSVERQKVWLPTLIQRETSSGLLLKPSTCAAAEWNIGLIFNSHTADLLGRERSTIRSFALVNAFPEIKSLQETYEVTPDRKARGNWLNTNTTKDLCSE